MREAEARTTSTHHAQVMYLYSLLKVRPAQLKNMSKLNYRRQQVSTLRYTLYCLNCAGVLKLQKIPKKDSQSDLDLIRHLLCRSFMLVRYHFVLVLTTWSHQIGLAHLHYIHPITVFVLQPCSFFFGFASVKLYPSISPFHSPHLFQYNVALYQNDFTHADCWPENVFIC